MWPKRGAFRLPTGRGPAVTGRSALSNHVPPEAVHPAWKTVDDLPVEPLQDWLPGDSLVRGRPGMAEATRRPVPHRYPPDSAVNGAADQRGPWLVAVRFVGMSTS